MAELTASELLVIRAKAEQSWKDNQLNKSLQTSADAAKAVLANQTVRIAGLDDWQKDNKVSLTFINPCAIDVADCEDNCAINAPMVSTNKKDYEPNLCKMAQFSIDETELRKNDYNKNDFLIRSMAQALGKLDEWWSVQVLAHLGLYAGFNAFPEPFDFNNATKNTEVPALNWNVELIADIVNQAYLNKLGDTYLLNDGTLWKDFYMAQMKAGNLDGKGEATLIQQVNMNFDRFNFAKSGVTSNLFVVSKDAVALQTVNKNSDTPMVLGSKVGQTRYTIPSPNLAGVKYDAFYEMVCKKIGNKDHIVHSWRFETNGLIALNPESCPIDAIIGGHPAVVQNTGVLGYKKTA